METLSFVIFIFTILNLVFALLNCFAVNDLVSRNKTLIVHNEILKSVIDLQNEVIEKLIPEEGEEKNNGTK